MKVLTALVETALILCGGLGTRLKPFTNNTPKPLVLCNEKPFLWYVLHQLSSQGIKKFILATGYLRSQFVEVFSNGSHWNWDISYSEGEVDWSTGRRVWEAQNLLPKDFLLLYGDNFTFFDLQTSLEQFRNGVALTMLVTPKESGEYQTKGNVIIDANGSVLDYQKYGNNHGYDHVEIGYMVLKKNKVLDMYFDKDCDFSDVMSDLCRANLANAVITHRPYHWLTDVRSLKATEAYLAKSNFFLSK